ncbi:MAG: hypothetical protein U5J64_01985 [Halobacteriales archaeon]|nr:hypothetical protein [Halobacteriales archaeon]
MRTRRQVILAGGTAVTVLASGCLEEVPEEDDETQNGEPQDGEDGNETDTNGEENGETDMDGENGEDEDGDGEEGEPEPASFEVSSVDAPETVEIGTSFDWSLTVRNYGGEDGVFETAVTRRRRGGEPEDFDTVSVEVPAGEEVSRDLSARNDFLGEYVYRLEETGEEFGVRGVERNLTFGETYVTPEGVRLTLETPGIGSNVDPIQSYSYTSEEGRRIHRAGPEEKFAVLNVTARNPTREPRELPRYDEFVMVVNEGAEYESTERLARDAYAGGTSRVSREGVVLFEIDDRFDRSDDYEVYWTRVYPEGNAEAVWSTPDEG